MFANMFQDCKLLPNFFLICGTQVLKHFLPPIPNPTPPQNRQNFQNEFFLSLFHLDKGRLTLTGRFFFQGKNSSEFVSKIPLKTLPKNFSVISAKSLSFKLNIQGTMFFSLSLCLSVSLSVCMSVCL